MSYFSLFRLELINETHEWKKMNFVSNHSPRPFLNQMNISLTSQYFNIKSILIEFKFYWKPNMDNKLNPLIK